jgi:hypothetical protein
MGPVPAYEIEFGHPYFAYEFNTLISLDDGKTL